MINLQLAGGSLCQLMLEAYKTFFCFDERSIILLNFKNILKFSFLKICWGGYKFVNRQVYL
nr:MAG TPA: hypothetical protein [Caudoviricetes sp.]